MPPAPPARREAAIEAQIGSVMIVPILAWLRPGSNRVSRKAGPARRKFQAGAHETVGVVPATSQAEFRLPVTAPARRYRLTAVVGQAGGRLRVVRIPVVS